jgi:hypothetical protein
MAAITGLRCPSPGLGMNWQKPISEYLQLGTIPDDEIKTECLECLAKGYLNHNDELYCHTALGILQRCIPVEEGKALHFDVHEGFVGTMLYQ